MTITNTPSYRGVWSIVWNKIKKAFSAMQTTVRLNFHVYYKTAIWPLMKVVNWGDILNFGVSRSQIPLSIYGALTGNYATTPLSSHPTLRKNVREKHSLHGASLPCKSPANPVASLTLPMCSCSSALSCGSLVAWSGECKRLIKRSSFVDQDRDVLNLDSWTTEPSNIK